MIKKGQMLKLTKPSTMRMVLNCIENGLSSRLEIAEETGLRAGQVKSALHNLAYIGAIKSATDEQGRNIYILPGRAREIARCLCGVNSIFNARFTTS